MAKMRTDNKEKIRQLKREIKDMKKDLKDTFADVPDAPRGRAGKKPAGVILRRVLFAAGFAVLAAGAYFIWRFGIII